MSDIDRILEEVDCESDECANYAGEVYVALYRSGRIMHSADYLMEEEVNMVHARTSVNWPHFAPYEIRVMLMNQRKRGLIPTGGRYIFSPTEDKA